MNRSENKGGARRDQSPDLRASDLEKAKPSATSESPHSTGDVDVDPVAERKFRFSPESEKEYSDSGSNKRKKGI
jgi:hypothetical protein